jgi:WD40 repeat protein
MEGHEDEVNSVSMDSACKAAVSGSDDNTVKLWDLGSGQCIKTYQGVKRVESVMMHESGGSFLSSGSGIFKAWTTCLDSDPPLIYADLSDSDDMTLIDSDRFLGAASRDLSRVGICFFNYFECDMKVSLWK